ncbi:MAG: hypothetical protein SFZ02_19155 [bacterium]|nr:hypothetical protein [bacterium]
MSAISSLYTAVFDAIRGVGLVYADYAPQNAMRPYIVFYFTSGGNTREVVNNRQRIVLTVKCVADNVSEAHTMASAFNAILEDAGGQETGVIDGDSQWVITTITQNGTVHYPEYDSMIVPIYHVGFEYEIVMEEI